MVQNFSNFPKLITRENFTFSRYLTFYSRKSQKQLMCHFSQKFCILTINITKLINDNRNFQNNYFQFILIKTNFRFFLHILPTFLRNLLRIVFFVCLSFIQTKEDFWWYSNVRGCTSIRIFTRNLREQNYQGRMTVFLFWDNTLSLEYYCFNKRRLFVD